MKGLVNTFPHIVSTVKALGTGTYGTTFSSLFFNILKRNKFPQSVHSVHFSEESVHESVHKVFTKCSRGVVNG